MNLEWLKEIVDKDSDATVVDYLLCLMEETGEISRTILEDKGIKKKKNKQTLKHEVVDAVLCSLGLYLKVAGSFDEDFVRITDEKMQKWENRAKGGLTFRENPIQFLKETNQMTEKKYAALIKDSYYPGGTTYFTNVRKFKDKEEMLDFVKYSSFIPSNYELICYTKLKVSTEITVSVKE